MYQYAGVIIGRSASAGVADAVTYDVEASLIADRRDVRESSCVVIRGIKPSNRPFPGNMLIAAAAEIGSPCRVTRLGTTFTMTLDSAEEWATTECSELFA